MEEFGAEIARNSGVAYIERSSPYFERQVSALMNARCNIDKYPKAKEWRGTHA